MIQLNALFCPARRAIFGSLASLAIVSLSACASEPEPTVILKMEVSESGAYLLDGTVVPKDDLLKSLAARRPEKGKLELRVAASPKTKYEDVAYLMKAAQELELYVGIVGSARP